MKKIIIFSAYFGAFPEHFPFFLKSVQFNGTIDFVILTDNDKQFKLPNNCRIVKITFEELRNRIQMLFPEFQIILDRPYKLCDYKPVWGLAYPELLTDYDFWGYCDIDLFLGDIRHFITDAVLESYEKIYCLGHLTLYRNTEENNSRYKLKASNAVYFKDAFTTTDIVAFDEIAGMQNIFDGNGFSTYKARDYADITWSRYRFTLSDFLLSPEQVKCNNFAKQVFYWESGHIYRAFWADGAIQTDEFIYIHFSKRHMELHNMDADCNSFFVTNKGLFPKQSEIQFADFDWYNPYEPEKERMRHREVLHNKRKAEIEYYWKIVKRKLGIGWSRNH